MTIVVPYRDRKQHLERFIPAMRAYLPTAQIVVVEQMWGGNFNRGYLLNAGYLEFPDTHHVFHDVDMIPVSVDYTERLGVTQLALSTIQLRDYLGGVTMFDVHTFDKLNGYPINFNRGEDNAMRFTIRRAGLPVPYRPGLFHILPHARGNEFDPQAWEAAKQPREAWNGLSGMKYSCRKVKKPGYTLLQVKTLIARS